MTKQKAIEVFFSYAHEDEELRNELAKHLIMLEREGVITTWSDREISAGDEWVGEIDEHLNNAQIILLLISVDFLASDYCYDVEMGRAIERHNAKDARVIPIILRHCDWRESRFARLQALPKNAKPLIAWEDLDEAFVDVVRGIRKEIQELATQQSKKVNTDEKGIENLSEKRLGANFLGLVAIILGIVIILISLLLPMPWFDVSGVERFLQSNPSKIELLSDQEFMLLQHLVTNRFSWKVLMNLPLSTQWFKSFLLMPWISVIASLILLVLNFTKENYLLHRVFKYFTICLVSIFIAGFPLINNGYISSMWINPKSVLSLILIAAGFNNWSLGSLICIIGSLTILIGTLNHTITSVRKK